jgi:hypothetical protein
VHNVANHDRDCREQHGDDKKLNDGGAHGLAPLMAIVGCGTKPTCTTSTSAKKE